jgi:hypothetical protein
MFNVMYEVLHSHHIVLGGLGVVLSKNEKPASSSNVCMFVVLFACCSDSKKCVLDGFPEET